MSFLEPFLVNFRTTRDRPLTNELLPDVKDNVFQWQLGSGDFARLDEESLLRSEVATHKSLAKKILKSAHNIGLIDCITGEPDTTKITRNMVNDMPVVGGISKQRELVMLLFFWEEELRRWRILEAEEQELKQKLLHMTEVDESKSGLVEALRIVQSRKRTLPSHRHGYDGIMPAANEQLPRYERVG